MVACHIARKYFELVNIFPFIIIFVFISGYFYKEQNEENIGKYIIKKFKKLIIPFFILNIVYGIISSLLRKNGIINYGSDITLYTTFVQPIINNSQYIFNFPAWFVPILFIINTIYVIIHKFSGKTKLLNDYVLLVIFIILQMITIYFKDLAQQENLIVVVLKVFFFLPFFHIGYLYKNKWQKYDDKIPTAPYLIILVGINYFLTQKCGDLIYDMRNFSNFQTNSLILPLITSIISILFYTRIARVLSKYIGENKLVNYIGNHTYAIMTHHLFIIFLLDYILYIINVPYFDVEHLKQGWMYIYDIPNWSYLIQFIYIIIGIMGPLAFQFIYDKIKEPILKKVIDLKQNK